MTSLPWWGWIAAGAPLWGILIGIILCMLEDRTDRMASALAEAERRLAEEKRRLEYEELTKDPPEHGWIGRLGDRWDEI